MLVICFCSEQNKYQSGFACHVDKMQNNDLPLFYIKKPSRFNRDGFNYLIVRKLFFLILRIRCRNIVWTFIGCTFQINNIWIAFLTGYKDETAFRNSLLVHHVLDNSIHSIPATLLFAFIGSAMTCYSNVAGWIALYLLSDRSQRSLCCFA